jgi:hypothetical protein
MHSYVCKPIQCCAVPAQRAGHSSAACQCDPNSIPSVCSSTLDTVPYADRSTVAIHCGQPYNGPSAVISAGVRQRRTECTASHPCKATLPKYSQYSLWVNRDHCAQCSVHATVEFHSICCCHSSWILTVHTCTIESTASSTEGSVPPYALLLFWAHR